MTVSGQREPVAYYLSAGALYRCGARVGGEVSLGRETRYAADCPDDLCSQYGTYPKDLGEGGAGRFYFGFDALA
jgi:hypothetical protein